MVNCKHWTGKTSDGFGVCALGLFGGKPSFGVCEKHCAKIELIQIGKPRILRRPQDLTAEEKGIAEELVTRQREEAGRRAWAWLHRFCWSCELQKPSPEQIGDELKRFEEIIPRHDCGGTCLKTYLEMVERVAAKVWRGLHPPPVDDPSRMVEWGWSLHERVNAKLGKKDRPTLADARAKWCKPRKLIIIHTQSPGDSIMLTSLLRDLHRAYPGEYLTGVRTCGMGMLRGNPYLVDLGVRFEPGKITGVNSVEQAAAWHDPTIEIVHPNWPDRVDGLLPCHFVQGFSRWMSGWLRRPLPSLGKCGEIYLTETEKQTQPAIWKEGPLPPYIVVNAGYKASCSAKAVNRDAIQKAIGLMPDVQFVQVGELTPGAEALPSLDSPGANGDGERHFQEPLQGPNVINLLGKTAWRETAWLIYHAAGTLSGITAIMHIAGAFGRPGVVLGGGREEPIWYRYDNHIALHSIGELDCCLRAGCWKDFITAADEKAPHAPPFGQATDKSTNLCVKVAASGRQTCQDRIRPGQIVEALRTILGK